jgi:hypothetical protein
MGCSNCWVAFFHVWQQVCVHIHGDPKCSRPKLLITILLGFFFLLSILIAPIDGIKLQKLLPNFKLCGYWNYFVGFL